MENRKKISFYTLGCKLNFAETDALARLFPETIYEKVKFGENADITVINSCSVTQIANKKSRNVIRKAIQVSPEALIVVTGCYAQLKSFELSDIEGVDLIIGNSDKFDIYKRVSEYCKKDSPVIYSCDRDLIIDFSHSYSIESRTRSYLKVQDGCDYFCTYCTIPLARGKSRNPLIKDLLSDVKQIIDKSVKEIVITGINVGDFGKSTGESFLNLIKDLDEVEWEGRYRISSIEPNLLSSEIISFVANSKHFSPHFHIPLQSGSDSVLKLMKRRYDTNRFKNLIEDIHNKIPECCIGIDVIVGSPGETSELFEECYTFLQNIDFTYLHVFSYSEGENTAALNIFPKISSKEKNIRSNRLQELSEKKKMDYYRRFIGKKLSVLFESDNNKGMISGFTENYIKVEIPFDQGLVNKIVEVELLELSESGKIKLRVV